MITTLLLLVLQHEGPSTTATFGTSESHRLPASLDSADGDVAVTHQNATGEVLHRFGHMEFLRIGGGVEDYHYDWSKPAARLPDDLQVLRLNITYIHAFDSQWIGVANASIAFQFEEGADVSDAGAYGGGVGLGYRFGPELTVGGLLRVQTRLEDRPYFMVVPYFEWKPSPSWTIRMEHRDGAGVEVMHHLDDTGAWALQSRVVYSERRFRLDDDAIRSEGIFEDARATVMVGIRWPPTPDLSVSLLVGLDLLQHFSLEDEEGHRKAEFESSPGPLVGFYFSYAF